MNDSFISISLVLLWCGAGALYAWLSLLYMQKSLGIFEESIGGKMAAYSMVSAVIRVAIMGILIYFSLMMNFVYSLILVASFTLTRLCLLVKISKESKQTIPKIEMN